MAHKRGTWTHPKQKSPSPPSLPPSILRNGNRLLPRRHHHHPYLQHLDSQPTPTQLFDSLQCKSFVCMHAAKATARRRRELPDRQTREPTDTTPLILHRLRDRRTTNKLPLNPTPSPTYPLLFSIFRPRRRYERSRRSVGRSVESSSAPPPSISPFVTPSPLSPRNNEIKISVIRANM